MPLHQPSGKTGVAGGVEVTISQLAMDPDWEAATLPSGSRISTVRTLKVETTVFVMSIGPSWPDAQLKPIVIV